MGIYRCSVFTCLTFLTTLTWCLNVPPYSMLPLPVPSDIKSKYERLPPQIFSLAVVKPAIDDLDGLRISWAHGLAVNQSVKAESCSSDNCPVFVDVYFQNYSLTPMVGAAGGQSLYVAKDGSIMVTDVGKNSQSISSQEAVMGYSMVSSHWEFQLVAGRAVGCSQKTDDYTCDEYRGYWKFDVNKIFRTSGLFICPHPVTKEPVVFAETPAFRRQASCVAIDGLAAIEEELPLVYPQALKN